MYLYHSDTQTTGPEELERPRGNFPSNFLKISFTTKHGGGIFFLSGFFSRTVTIHRTAGEGGSYLFNFSVPLPPAPQILTH